MIEQRDLNKQNKMGDEVIILIRLFAENNLSDIENDISPLIKQYFDKDWSITKEDFYCKHYDLIKGFKKNIENIVCDPMVLTEKEQVIKCLELCWKKSNFNTSTLEIFKYQMEVFSKLVLVTFKKSWSENQKIHFKVVSEIFCDYNNYFISYTNHFAQTINNNYNLIYKSLFTSDDYSDDELTNKNLLAKAFNKYFGLRNLRKGFFDRDSIRISDIISEKVKKNVEQSIALVQLLSKASFQYTEPNWSFDEFSGYTKSREKFLKGNSYQPGFTPLPFFILIEKNPFPTTNDLIPDEYAEWIELVKAELHSDISGCIDYKKFSEDIERLITDIVNFKSQLICNVPE
jgi:hypothetical protein